MIVFLILMVVMLLLAVAIIVIPYWKAKANINVATNSINIELFKSNEAQLKQQYQTGELSEQDYQQALTELQLTLLDDAKTSDSLVKTDNANTWAVISSITFVLIVSPMIYFYIGSQQWLEFGNSSAEQNQSFAMLVEKLERRLEQQPDDVEGWLLLSRSYIKFKEYDKAANAYGHLHQLVGDEPALLVDYADVLTMVGTSGALILAEMLLNKALQQSPHDRDGLWIMGNVKYKQHNYDQALEYLNKAKQQFILDNDPHNELIKQIARVKNEQ